MDRDRSSGEKMRCEGDRKPHRIVLQHPTICRRQSEKALERSGLISQRFIFRHTFKDLCREAGTHQEVQDRLTDHVSTAWVTATGPNTFL